MSSFKVIPRNAQHNNTVQVSARDPDFAGDKPSRNYVSGPIFLVEGMILGWKCRKQAFVLLSTMEADFMLASHTGQEIPVLRELLAERKFEMKLLVTIRINKQ